MGFALGGFGQGFTSGAAVGSRMRGSLANAALQRKKLAQDERNQAATLKVAQEKVQLLQEDMAMKRQTFAHTQAASTLTQAQSLHVYTASRLADLGALPINDRPKAYQRTRKDLIKVGVGADSLPTSYNQAMSDRVQVASVRSPTAVKERKFQQDVLLQHMKSAGAISAATAKQAGSGSAYQTAFQKNEATKDSDNFDAIASDAATGSEVKEDVKEIMALANGLRPQLGIVMGNTVRLTPKGQAFYSKANHLVLTLLAKQKHVSRASNMIMGIIKSAKLGAHLSLPAMRMVAESYLAQSNQSIERNKFANFMKKNHIDDRNRRQNIWNTFQDHYPSVNPQTGAVLPNQAKNWGKYLQDNPSEITETGPASAIAPKKADVPSGFIMPGQQAPAPQQVPMGAPPAAPAPQMGAPAPIGPAPGAPQVVATAQAPNIGSSSVARVNMPQYNGPINPYTGGPANPYLGQ